VRFVSASIKLFFRALLVGIEDHIIIRKPLRRNIAGAQVRGKEALT
jgi:hypothetical protein